MIATNKFLRATPLSVLSTRTFAREVRLDKKGKTVRRHEEFGASRMRHFVRKVDEKGENGNPPTDLKDTYALRKQEPISENMKLHVENITRYITQEWLSMYPLGARLRKLQRDIAFRMPRKERPGKIPYEELLPILGHVESKGLINIRKSGKGLLLITSPKREKAIDERDIVHSDAKEGDSK